MAASPAHVDPALGADGAAPAQRVGRVALQIVRSRIVDRVPTRIDVHHRIGGGRGRRLGVHAAVRQAGYVSRAVLLHDRYAQEQRIRNDGHVVRRTKVSSAVVAQSYLDESRSIADRLLRDHIDGAADGVLAFQRALRAAQNFDPVQVEQIEGGSQGGREVHAVDIDTDARLARREVEVALADAADERGVGLSECR